MRATRHPANFMEELYFPPVGAEALPSRSYFGEEPEFEEDLSEVDGVGQIAVV